MKTHWRKIRSELTRRRSRTVLATLSLIVGIFAIGTIFLVTSEVQTSFNQDFDDSNPPSAVVSIEPFDTGLLDSVRALDAVGEAEGRHRLLARSRADGDGWMNFELVAMPDFGENSIGDQVQI